MSHYGNPAALDVSTGGGVVKGASLSFRFVL